MQRTKIGQYERLRPKLSENHTFAALKARITYCRMPGLIPSILKMKCPNCRKGNMFTNKSIFPLRKLQDMPEKCPVCGQKMELEVGFYYGTGYVSYGICVAFSIFNVLWYWLIFGLSVQDDSLFWYLGVNIGLLILCMPFIVRYSRVLYLNMFVKYRSLEEAEEERKSRGHIQHKDESITEA